MDVLQQSWRDTRHAVRSLVKRPGFALTAILSLALGIGLNTAIFGVVDSVLLKPLPLPSPDRLVVIEEKRDGREVGSNGPRLIDWAEQVPSFASATGFYGEGQILTGMGDPERVSLLRTFGDFLAVTGLKPELGRALSPAEQRGEGEPLALLSHSFWVRRFNGEQGVVGRALNLGTTAYTIAGVLPEAAGIASQVDVFVPAPRELQAGNRGAGFLGLVARLRDGVAMRTAQAEVDTVASRLAAEHSDTDKGLSAHLEPLLDSLTREARLPLLALFGAVAFVLLAACVNLASLLLARGEERRREAALRSALGAGQASLIRLFLAESVLVALAGGLAGLAFAGAGIEILRAILPEDLPRLATAAVDWRVTSFAILLSLLCATIFGLLPSWQAARANLRDEMIATRRSWLRGALVATQVALSLILLAGTALLAQSFWNMRRAPLGFRPAQILTVQTNFSWDTPKEKLDAYYDAALARLSALPGVVSAGLADRLPLDGGSQSATIQLRGKTLEPALATLSVSQRGIGGSYFETLGTSLLRGRMAQDSQTAREVLINETMARTFFGAEDPIGQSISFVLRRQGGAEPKWLTIVGVIGDVRQSTDQRSQPSEAFVPMRTVYWPLASFVVKTTVEPGTLANAARAALLEIDPIQMPGEIRTLEASVEGATSSERRRLWLIGAFALTTLLLAAIGLYGLLAADVARRRQEIGIRMALGAQPHEVMTQVLRRGWTLTAIGACAGIVGAIVVTRLLSSMFPQAEALSPLPLAAAAMVLAAVATLACLAPARRAARVDPISALRHE